MSSFDAVILAAGKGTRMRSERAKVLHEVVGEPMLGHVVRAVLEAGAGKVVVVVGHGREEVAASLAARFDAAQVTCAVQEEQLGTGHAVWSAREALAASAGRVMILCGDVPNLSAASLRAFVEADQAAGGVISVMSAQVAEPRGYGRIVRDEAGRVTRIVEHLDATEAERAIHEINTGTYLADAAFLRGGLDVLMASAAQNAKKEYYLTDLVERGAGQGGASAWLLAEPREAQGVNTRADLAAAGAFARERINRRWMEAGVELIDPSRVLIGLDVVLEADAVIYPDVVLEGKTRVGAGAFIEQGCVLRDATIGAFTHLKPYCVITESSVGMGSDIGPFAHLRPGSEIGAKCKVGNFVETKKTKMADGSKANHLSYLGDAFVGAKANVGAGTITCNYDGTNKSHTHIGAGAFIGSNSALVAPVKIGDGAYVAAGSVITQEVPEDALGVARERQRNIEGWARRKKK
jgi:bifunctional UDP-N-acetylglucosamine pyrophosphorylase / glucosamine-1-phosphate N-acetyltransferase